MRAHNRATEMQQHAMTLLLQQGWYVSQVDDTSTPDVAIWMRRGEGQVGCLTPMGDLLEPANGQRTLRVNYSTWRRVVTAGRR